MLIHGMKVTVCESGTVVALQEGCKPMVVNDDTAVFGQDELFVTQHVYDKLKERSVAARGAGK